VPLDLLPGGVRLRFVSFGFVHQSNGQASTLSRSWNRAYAQFGAELGDLALLARVWTRLGGVDDNPDIYNYMGHGDLEASYRWRGHELKALLRRNLRTDKGAVQASWAFPLIQNLKGYVQVFSGYGASLIDYNSYQHTYGLGVLVDF
jgi:phospholipase A1